MISVKAWNNFVFKLSLYWKFIFTKNRPLTFTFRFGWNRIMAFQNMNHFQASKILFFIFKNSLAVFAGMHF